MTIVRALTGLFFLSALASCATGRRAAGGSVIERLEAARAERPASAEVARALGIAYYDEGRWAEARTVLADAHARAPRDGTTALYLGMSAEQLGDHAAAREAYGTYLRHGRTSRVRRDLQNRLAALARLEMRASVRAALTREGELAATASDPNVVAVMPFRFTGSDGSLRPLERGLADLTVTDLARIASLKVVERAQVQALLDEIDLGSSARADSALALRSGRILQAGRIVQGSITQLPGNATIRLDGAVVDVPTAEARGARGTDDRLDELFAMQKRFTFAILDALGVQPSAEERSAIEQRPTRSLAAFLAYSNGLAEADAGRLDAADRSFGEALRHDPSFGLARDRQQETQAAMIGAATGAATIEQSLQGTAEGRVAAAATQGDVRSPSDAGGGTLAGIVDAVNPSVAAAATSGSTPVSTRDPASATTGTEQFRTEKGTVIIIVRQPDILRSPRD